MVSMFRLWLRGATSRLAKVGHQSVELFLAQAGFREVRGRESTGARRKAMRQQRFDVGENVIGQGFDRCSSVQGRAVDDFELQAAVLHLGDDIEQIDAAASGVFFCARSLAGDAEDGLDGDAVHATEVVEAELRPWQVRELRAKRGIGAEVAEDPIADASIGNASKLLLDRFQLFSRAVPFEHQAHWEDGGEPAYRAGKVEVGK